MYTTSVVVFRKDTLRILLRAVISCMKIQNIKYCTILIIYFLRSKEKVKMIRNRYLSITFGCFTISKWLSFFFFFYYLKLNSQGNLVHTNHTHLTTHKLYHTKLIGRGLRIDVAELASIYSTPTSAGKENRTLRYFFILM